MLQYFKIFIKFCTSNDHLLEETRRWNSDTLNARVKRKLTFADSFQYINECKEITY